MSVRNDILKELISGFNVIRTSSSYAVTLNDDVVGYDENVLTKGKYKTPCIMIRDTGNEQRLIDDGTNTRFAFDVDIIGFVRTQSWAKVQENTNAIVAAVKQYINSGPDLGDYVLALQYVEGLGVDYDQQGGLGSVGIRARVIYWCTNGTY